MTRASERLATVFRGSVEIKKLAATMQLGDQPFVAFPQSVGARLGTVHPPQAGPGRD